MYELKAALKSPLMIGGKTLNSNYRKSKEFIPGSVLRAAYAKALIQRCGCTQENYWLEYKAQSPCEACAFRTVCKNFAEIAFPTLYPMGSIPYPVTARTKKYKNKGEKSVLDILKCRLAVQGKTKEEPEWKRLEGFNKNGATVRLLHSAITRTAIDYRRNASKEGALYTQEVVLDKCQGENEELLEVVFSGKTDISKEEAEALNQIAILHIGADITRGFGVCQMSCKEIEADDTPEDIENRIQEFNDGIGEREQFVVVDLLTDAYLGLEEIGEDNLCQTAVSDEQMLAFLEKKIGLPNEKYHLRKVYKSQEVLRGFDTSKRTEKEMRRRGRLVVKAGAVFVYQASSEEIDGKELLKFESEGIGDNVKHGFGKVRICDRFHITYDVLKGGRNE